MDKLKIIHTGDFHIDSPLSALGKSAKIRQAELLDTFGRVIDLAAMEKADILLISGDLFDNSAPSAAAIGYVKRKLAEIPEIPVFIVLGNHDADLKTDFPENVHVFGSSLEKLEFDGFDIYGISFAEEYCPLCMIEGFSVDNPDKINILLIHCEVVPKGQKSAYNPVTASDIAFSGADYAALGHTHQFSGVLREGGVNYAYCGVPDGRGFDETGEKGIIIGQIFKNRAELSFVPVCSRKYTELDIDVTDCADCHDICRKITEAADNERDLYKINLTGSVPEGFIIDTPFIAERLSESLYFVKVNDFTTISIDIKSLSRENSLRGIFVRKALEKGRGNEVIKYGLSAIAGEKVPVE